MINNFSVGKKMFLMVAIPTISLLAFVMIQSWEQYSTVKNSRSIAHMVSLTEASGNLIHEIQKERGFSSGFSASRGQIFAQELREQRRLTQQLQQQLRETLHIFVAAVPRSPLREDFAAVLTSLDGLAQMHSQIDAFQVAPAQVIEFYTQLIRELQVALAAVLDSCQSVSLYAQTSTLVSFINAKEFAGQERATLNAALSTKTFSKQLYRAWVERVALQEEYLRNFFSKVAHSPREIFLLSVRPLLQNVEQFRRAAFNSLDKSELDGDPKEWFAASTAYIDAMHKVELAICADLQKLALEMREEALRALYINMAGTGTVLVATVLLGMLVLRNVTVPLATTVAFAQQVAQGRLQEELHLSREDELGQLSKALNAMLLSLNEMIAKAEKAMEQARLEAEKARQATQRAEDAHLRAEVARREGMGVAAERLEDVVQGLSQVSQNLSEHIDQAERGAKEQSERLGETATAMEEMNATVMEVARNSAKAAETADTARQQALQGRTVAEGVASNIDSVMGHANNLKEAMGRLGIRVQSVDRVLGVISDIADQTNLLALNAAIEAARAGDAGRGFAVVADEVRKLAEKTMDATREVGQVLSGIQQDTASNISTVENTVRAMESTTVLSRQSGEALQKVVTMVDATTDQIRSIATAAEQQSATSEEINRSVMDVNRLAEGTSSVMEQSTQSVRDLLHQSRDLQSLIVQMQSGA